MRRRKAVAARRVHMRAQLADEDSERRDTVALRCGVQRGVALAARARDVDAVVQH
jgi:hypothetical protein